jgi:CheY-like chemotaxis protein
MKNINILWVDDEIDLLRPHILFLEEKGYLVSTANSGSQALEHASSQNFDIVFLDENMPGMSGLETLTKIKDIIPLVPVVMITKSEEEDFMDEAIGSKIADYLIKPVNPNQILLTIKKNIDNKRLVTKVTTSAYQSEFGKIGASISEAHGFEDWADVYRKLVFWELELSNSDDQGMDEVLKMQKTEANKAFAKFIKSIYTSWFDPRAIDKPLMSQNLFKNSVIPMMEKKEKVFFILIDNLRLDQWRTIYPLISDYFTIEKEELYCSILPTATQFARNSIFAGLMPMEISKLYPDIWLNEEDENTNNYEEELLKKQLQRSGIENKLYYEKILNFKAGKKLLDTCSNLLNYDLVVLVYNFVDMLSHARTEMEMIRELANDDAAYRSITHSWFQHSHLLELIKELSSKDIKIVITTDHGTIRVNNPIKVVGDRTTTKNLRFKDGKNLNYNSREVFEIKDPSAIHLPKTNFSSSYIFALNNDYFVYPNNYNQFVNYYRNTFQHGGVSMEEMMIPLITLVPNAKL